MDKNKGELMKVSGFGPLEAMQHWRPEDYRNYLKAVSATNKSVKLPQFHAVISAGGKSHDKHELTKIAAEWLAAMGYGEQPYLLIFHKDTQNNHIHLVTTRVDKQGKKISDSFENIRAQKHLNQILGVDEKHSAKQDIAKALSYTYSTKAQFMMILESRGYTLKEEDGKMAVFKFGHRQDEIDLKQLGFSAAKPERVSQVKAIFTKYTAIYDTALLQKILPNRQNARTYTSDFAAYLKEKHGLELLFHASGDKPPYGYSVIDHAGKAVFKGSEIIALKELLAIQPGKIPEVKNEVWTEQYLNEETTTYYRALLKAALYNYPDLAQGLRAGGLDLLFDGERLFLADKQGTFHADAGELLDEADYRHMARQFGQHTELSQEVEQQFTEAITLSIADDVDDQQIHGMRRRRQKKARTNTR